MNAPFQKAIYDALAASSPLMAVITGIYDKAHQVNDSGAIAAFPFVTIGDDVISAWSTDDWSGGEAVARVHVWSRYGGNKQAAEIIGLIRAALDRASLTIAGYGALSCDYQQSFVEPDPDGETRHGVIEFRVLICP